MAKGKKTGGRNIKPGQCLPGAGRPPLSPEVKQVRKLTTQQYIEIINLYLHKPVKELEEILKDKIKTPALHCIVVSVLVKAIKEGDDRRLEAMLARLIGKTPIVIDETIEYVIKRATDNDKEDEE